MREEEGERKEGRIQSYKTKGVKRWKQKTFFVEKHRLYCSCHLSSIPSFFFLVPFLPPWDQAVNQEHIIEMCSRIQNWGKVRQEEPVLGFSSKVLKSTISCKGMIHFVPVNPNLKSSWADLPKGGKEDPLSFPLQFRPCHFTCLTTQQLPSQ